MIRWIGYLVAAGSGHIPDAPPHLWGALATQSRHPVNIRDQLQPRAGSDPRWHTSRSLLEPPLLDRRRQPPSGSASITVLQPQKNGRSKTRTEPSQTRGRRPADIVAPNPAHQERLDQPSDR